MQWFELITEILPRVHKCKCLLVDAKCIIIIDGNCSLVLTELMLVYCKINETCSVYITRYLIIMYNLLRNYMSESIRKCWVTNIHSLILSMDQIIAAMVRFVMTNTYMQNVTTNIFA